MDRQKGEHTARPLTRVSERLRLATSHNPERDNGYAVTPDSRECDCPRDFGVAYATGVPIPNEEVVQCAHFGADYIALLRIDAHFWVQRGIPYDADDFDPQWDDTVVFDSYDYDAALAAFYAAEEALLRGAS